MKSRILATILLFASSVFAADPTPQTQEQKVIVVIRQQRDQLAQQMMDLQAQLQLVMAENEALKKQLAEAQKPAEPVKK